MNDLDNEPLAFPSDSREARQFAGMTLRDWFAGLALAGMIACCVEPGGDWPDCEKTSERAFKYADEMLKARKAAP